MTSPNNPGDGDSNGGPPAPAQGQTPAKEGGGNRGPGGFGGKKPFPKTFGDVMRGIPAGKGGDGKPGRGDRGDRGGGGGGGERRDRPQGGQEARPGGERPEGGRGGKRGDRGPRREEQPKKGPIVVRKPPPLGKDGQPVAAAPAEGAEKAAAQAPQHAPAEDRAPKRPKTVFRRADGVNLPPREAEGEKALTPTAAPVIDEPVEDFAAMFAESEKERGQQKRFEIGQKVSGRIVQIGSDTAFLDLGGKGEGMISLGELRDSEGDIAVTMGEILEGYILSMGPEGIIITKQLSKGAQREFLVQARDGGIPVEGLVTGHNKGGLEVDLGGVRGFCPVSQVDVRFVQDITSFVGQRLAFRVTELKDRDVVLSRRALLESEAARKAEETRQHLHVGAQLEGTVTSVRDFGAFVDLGGIEGLVHVSELGYGRVTHPKDVLSPGQKVTVEVVRIDQPKEGEKAERIALSMKALQEDPWETAMGQLAEGQTLKGKVVRLQPFGAFVELMPGVDGLVHISALGQSKRINHPKEVVNEGEEVTVAIEGIDRVNKRIQLRRITEEELAGGEAPVVEGGQPAPARTGGVSGGPPRVGDVHEVTVDKVEPFGLFVRFPGGRGLVPNAEMGTPKGTDHKKQFPPGATFKAAILEVDGTGRVRLSRTAAEKEEERAEYREFQKGQKQPSGKGFGTFGDLLKGLKK